MHALRYDTVTSQCSNTLVIEDNLAMGLFEYLTRNNKVGVMNEEKELFDKVRRAPDRERMTEKKGPTPISEGESKMQPSGSLELESQGQEKKKKNQGMTKARKKKLAKQRREEGLVFRNRLKNCKY